MTRSAPNKLTLDLMLQLAAYVRETYANSGLSEEAFAEKAGQDLGFPVVTSNVNSARQALGIPANKQVKSQLIREMKEAKKRAAELDAGQVLILNELHALNRGVAMLSGKLDQLLKR